MMHKIYFWYKFHQKNQKMLSYIFFVYSWQLIYFNRVVFYYFDKKNNILLSKFYNENLLLN